MKTLYIECNMGAAGDMLMSALLELHPNPEDFLKRLNAVNIPNVNIGMTKEKKCGISGTHIRVNVGGVEEDERIYERRGHSHKHEHNHGDNHQHNHEHNHGDNHQHNHEHNHGDNHDHKHSHFKDIENLIGHLGLTENVYNDVIQVYRLIAEAESNAHNCEIENIHFHEVGTMDAVADIVGVCMLINELNVDEIFASNINVGKGKVKCSHGILPVPAPATAYILRDVPIYNNEINGELCTPTGAALLKHFVSKFGEMPVMKISKIGYGLGTKDFETANFVRAFLGEKDGKTDTVTELLFSVDDMTGERIGFAVNRIFEAGALEVFTTAIGMKKNRPGILFTCLCRENKKEEIIDSIFKYTTTIGIRENVSKRYVLDRAEETVQTKYGDVRVKKSQGYGVVRRKAEYDDLEKIAIENDIDISDINEALIKSLE